MFSIALQIINDISLPFTGEPLEGSQIMGFLETQALDFKKVILVNCTEGILPTAASNSGSFIPYNLRKAYRLTLPEDSEARQAYLFFRLFHKASEIVLIHAAVSEETKAAEQSRFLAQLHYLFQWKLPIQMQSSSITARPQKSFVLPNQDLYYQILLEKYVTAKETSKSMLSPSSLNTWLDCRLKFFLSKIVKLPEPPNL
jgi:hypothetical protein